MWLDSSTMTVTGESDKKIKSMAFTPCSFLLLFRKYFFMTTSVNSNLHNMLISLNEQQKNHTINFADYDVLKIQFKDQSINNALFSREYLRPSSKQIMDSICLYNGTSVHELFFTVSFDPVLKYVYVSDAYICRVDVADGTVTSVTPPIIQAVFGMQCIN